MAALRCCSAHALKFSLTKNSPLCSSHVRWLNLHEYQSKKLMQDNGVNVQKFRVAATKDDAVKISQSFSVREFVIKAQILAGGRGKGVFNTGFKGGVHLTKDKQRVPELVSQMLGNSLVTKQTSKDGVKVQRVMVAEALDISRETYLAILMDRESNGPVLVGSPQGGMDIEEVAAKSPDAIFKEVIDITQGVTDKQATQMAKNLGFSGKLQTEAANQIKRLYALFLKVDATQIEVNPFGETPDGQVVCFDAKINFDDNAEFRQKEIFAQEDQTEMDPREIDATKHHLNYVGMEGNIGCLVNGAGLAMATMDIIKLHGGSPANFLDVGGGVNEAQVHQAFRILTSDSQVKAILVNVFGGIVNCATIAKGIISAAKTLGLTLPVVVRLEGTNVGEAKRLLKESGLKLIAVNDFDEAAKKCVETIRH